MKYTDSYKKKNAKKKTSFLKGMGFYAVIFIVIVTLTLILQWNWLSAYNMARSDSVIKAYITNLTAEQVKPLCLNSFKTLDGNFVTPEEAYDIYAAPYFSNNLTYKKDSAGSTESMERYVIFSGGKEIGSVKLEQNGEPILKIYLFGPELKTWKITEEAFDFSFLDENRTAQITAPLEYTVYFHGVPLGEEYITDKNNRYESLSFLTDYGIELPYMATYTVDHFMGEADFKIIDSDGNEVEEGINYENILINNCDEEEMTRLTKFLTEYVKYYVAFMGCARGDSYGPYNNLAPYLLPGSELAERMSSIRWDMNTYSNNKSNEVLDVTVNYCIRTGDGEYVGDVTYLNKSLGAQGEYVTTKNYYHIFMKKTDTGVYAYEMISYKNAEPVSD